MGAKMRAKMEAKMEKIMETQIGTKMQNHIWTLKLEKNVGQQFKLKWDPNGEPCWGEPQSYTKSEPKLDPIWDPKKI